MVTETVLLLGGKDNLQPSLLFQFATHWAEIGLRVAYLSSTPLNEVPSHIHGTGFPSSAALKRIQFLYLPRTQDLLQHLFSLHCHALVPSAIILQGLENYCRGVCGENGDGKNGDSDISHIPQILAALVDALRVCGSHNGKEEETFCICTYDSTFHSSFVNSCSIFFDNIWLMEPNSGCSSDSTSDDSKVITVKRILQHGVYLEKGSSLQFMAKKNTMFLHKFFKMIRS